MKSPEELICYNFQNVQKAKNFFHKPKRVVFNNRNVVNIAKFRIKISCSVWNISQIKAIELELREYGCIFFEETPIWNLELLEVQTFTGVGNGEMHSSLSARPLFCQPKLRARFSGGQFCFLTPINQEDHSA